MWWNRHPTLCRIIVGLLALEWGTGLLMNIFKPPHAGVIAKYSFISLCITLVIFFTMSTFGQSISRVWHSFIRLLERNREPLQKIAMSLAAWSIIVIGIQIVVGIILLAVGDFKAIREGLHIFASTCAVCMVFISIYMVFTKMEIDHELQQMRERAARDVMQESVSHIDLSAAFLESQEIVMNIANNIDFHRTVEDSIRKVLPVGVAVESSIGPDNTMIIDMMLPLPRRVSVSVTAIPKHSVPDNQKFNFITGGQGEAPAADAD